MSESKIMKILGKRIYLRPLTPSDVTVKYLSWMNDSDVVQYLESRFAKHTLKGLKQHLALMMSETSDKMFGIFLNDSDMHIGNIKLSHIDRIHKFATIGLVIGDKGQWGKGYGSEAINVLTKYAFKVLKLRKLSAGIYGNNLASCKAFVKSGYREAGRYLKHRLYKKEYVDEVFFERSRD